MFADRGMFWDLCDGQPEMAFEMFISTVVDGSLRRVRARGSSEAVQGVRASVLDLGAIGADRPCTATGSAGHEA